jgi:hypothetical protein
METVNVTAAVAVSVFDLVRGTAIVTETAIMIAVMAAAVAVCVAVAAIGTVQMAVKTSHSRL